MKDIFEQFNFDTSVYQKYKINKQKLIDIFDTKTNNLYDKINKLKKRREKEEKSLSKIIGRVDFAGILLGILLWLYLVFLLSKWNFDTNYSIIVKLFCVYFSPIFIGWLFHYLEKWLDISNIITFGKYEKLKKSISNIDSLILKIEKDIEKLGQENNKYLEKLKNGAKAVVAPFEEEFCDYYERELADFYNTKLFKRHSDSDGFADDLFAFKILLEDLQKVNNIFLTRKISLWEYEDYVNKRESKLDAGLRKIFSISDISSLVEDTVDNRKIKKLHKFVKTVQKKHKNKPAEQKYKSPRKVDWQKVNIKNQKTGLKGEEIVMELEKEFLSSVGRDDLAQGVRHVSVVDGDGAGYDIKSFFENGTEKYIEVKSTVNLLGTQYFISSNELSFLRENMESYFIYRVSLKNNEEVILQVISGGDFLAGYTLNPVQYSVKSKV